MATMIDINNVLYVEYCLYLTGEIDHFSFMQFNLIPFNGEEIKKICVNGEDWDMIPWSANDPVSIEERKKYNSDISKKYINDNLMTFDEWVLKTKSIEIAIQN